MTSEKEECIGLLVCGRKESDGRMRAALIIGLGGFVGVVLRYLLSLLPFAQRTGFPVVTLAINILGAFLIGILAGVAVKFPAFNGEWMAFLQIGVCGGFTTFSTFALESTVLLGGENVGAGLLYIGLSLFIGLGAVWLGRAMVM